MDVTDKARRLRGSDLSAGDRIPATVTPGLMSNFVKGMRKATFYQATAGRADNGSRPLISGKVLPVKFYRLHHQRFSSQSRIARELSWRSDLLSAPRKVANADSGRASTLAA